MIHFSQFLFSYGTSLVDLQITMPTETESKQKEQFEEQSKLYLPAKIFMLAGCADDDVSADISDARQLRPGAAGLGGGVCTNALLGFLQTQQEAPSWRSLLENLRSTLSDFSQVPQVSMSQKVNIDEQPFSVVNEFDAEGKSSRKAILIGINYKGQEFELDGCVNDAVAMKQYLEGQGFKNEGIRLLVDEGDSESPTAQNIIDAIRWLVQDAKAGDSLFLHFSGHGTSTTDSNGDENDGNDECILPVDYQEVGAIVDDDLLKELILPLQGGVQLVATFDACHSQTLLDLPFVVSLKDMTLVENKQFRLSKVLEIGKALIDKVNGSLAGFVKGLQSVIPI